MGITVTLRGGSGDMSKHVYDPNLDGVIAIPETEADMTKAVFDPDDAGKIPVKRIEGGSVTGAIVDYANCADKTLDYQATVTGIHTVWSDSGNPYTVALADMDDRSGQIKITLSGEIRTSAAGGVARLGYTLDGGAVVEIGNHTGDTAWAAVSKADVVVTVGQVIQFRCKDDSCQAHAQFKRMLQTHAAQKVLIGYYE